MKTKNLFAWLLLGILTLFAAAPASAQEPTRRTLREQERKEAAEVPTRRQLAARLAAVERLLGIEPPVTQTRPKTRPDTRPKTRPDTRPDTRPKTEPRTPPGEWPAVGTTRVSFKETGKDLKRLSFAEPRADSWSVEEGWRFVVMRRPVAGALFILTLEQFEGYDATRVTAAFVNGFPERGAVVFDSLSVRTGDALVYQVRSADSPGPDAIQVRGTLARRAVIGPDAARVAAYAHVEPVAGYPDWVGPLCVTGLQTDLAHANTVGLYTVWDSQVNGPSSLDGSHGGWKVAPWHFGAEGWQRGDRRGYVWAEASMFGTLDRSPLASYDPETLRPLNQHSPYWAGRANSPLPGLVPDGNPLVPYLGNLEHYEAHGSSHGQRLWGAAAMLAPFDAWARVLLVEQYWHDCTLWLDGGNSPYGLLKPLAQVQSELPAQVGWSGGGRGFAHVLRCFLYAEPYLSPAARGDAGNDYAPLYRESDGAKWRPTLRNFLVHTTRPNGILHYVGQGNNLPHGIGNDDQAGLVPYPARAREVDLQYPNLEAFGLGQLATACRNTMRAVDGVSVASSFDGSQRNSWSEGVYSKPNYYAKYDWIRGEFEGYDLKKILAVPAIYGPNEQDLSMIPPAKVFEVLK
jgi:hypothetical protein